MIEYNLTPITQQAELEALCTEAAQEPYVTIDTEFVRETTYWPQLCLVQIGTSKTAAAIDTLAPDLDLAPLFALMANTAVLKVFHAARQDLEIMHYLSGGQVPTPLFDTQIAAMVCGFGENIGYEPLVGSIVGAAVDKSSRYTNWAKRPLTQEQIEYALGDVSHLRQVYEHLRDMMAEKQREHWLDDEMAVLGSPETYAVDFREAWRRLKPRSDKPKFLAILRELADRREREAQRRDVPRNRVMRDDTVLELAAVAPQSVDALVAIRGVDKGRAQGAFGASLLEAIRIGTATPKADCPSLPKRQGKLPSSITTQVELLRVLLQFQSQEFGVAPKLLANAEDLRVLAQTPQADLPATQGWRHEIFGARARELLDGKLCIRIKDGQVVCEAVQGAD